MKKMNIVALMLTMVSSSVFAKISEQESAKLGLELTAVGAEMKGNAAGSIPKYLGGLAQDINANPYKDIYSDEKPLFFINGENFHQYENNLTEGQIALFKKHNKTYTMPVYKTHRTASYPKNILEKAKKNSITSELISGGNGIKNFDETLPFAIPKNGIEALWNHETRFHGGSIEVNSANIPVQVDGSFTAEKIRAKMANPLYLKEGYDNKKDENILFYYTAAIKAPARLTGNVLLIHETIDQVSEPRKAWQYNSGQRRVRRAPQVAYDAPDTQGMRTTDQVDMFNGSPDRYNWKLMGKKEIYIPYNSYKLADTSAKYEDIIAAGHINQEYTRYELHRVWHIQATLKEGVRHVYSKRDLYLDEDSWQIAIADHYNSRGELWRISEGHSLQFVNANVPWYVANTNYDLSSGRYMIQLSNEEKNAFVFGAEASRKNFTAAALRRSGKR